MPHREDISYFGEGVVNRSVIAYVRTSVDGCQQILVMANVSDTTVSIHVPQSFEHSRASELICMGATWQAGNYLSLAPGGVAWLTRTP